MKEQKKQKEGQSRRLDETRLETSAATTAKDSKKDATKQIAKQTGKELVVLTWPGGHGSAVVVSRRFKGGQCCAIWVRMAGPEQDLPRRMTLCPGFSDQPTTSLQLHSHFAFSNEVLLELLLPDHGPPDRCPPNRSQPDHNLP